MSKIWSCVWIIGGITLKFHALLKILLRKDRFTTIYPHTTQFFAQMISSLTVLLGMEVHLFSLFFVALNSASCREAKHYLNNMHIM